MRQLLILLGVVGWACSPGPMPLVEDAGVARLCVGGVVRDGKCEAKCDPSKCLPGNTCVDNACVLKCTGHTQCLQYSQECRPAKEDDTHADIFVCTHVPPREYGDPCPYGTECSNICLSSGPGDAKSYCTMGCLADADCPGGYECGYVRDPHRICGTTKGNNNHCGTTTDACIDRANLTPQSGYVEGHFCLQRRLCTKKEVCASCETDVDCSRAGLSCVTLDVGDKRCLAACTQSTDCDADKHCEGNFCVPKFGKCAGGGFCEPCRFDTDCGPNFACVGLHGNEKACLDMTFSISCNTAADCPLTPGNVRGSCLGPEMGVQPNSAAYKKCYAPYDKNNNAFSCY